MSAREGNNPPHVQGRRRAFRVIARQGIVTLVMAGVFFVGSDFFASYSALLGGLVSVLANAIFAWFLFRQGGARQARSVVGHFYFGELLKIAATVILFGGVLYSIPVYPPALFAGYIVPQSVLWLELLRK